MKPILKKTYLTLFLIFLIGTFLRFYRLPKSPLGFYVDEAAIGYNSYSILETGKDEYGKPFPIYFRSFADYKMPLYIYLSIIPIKLFGLSVFSVRFVSAVFGSLTIILVFFLTRQLFPSKKSSFALLVSFLFSITPLSVFFSRMALEVSLALFMLLTGLFYQLKYFEKKKYVLIIISVLFYVMSSYSYHTEKYISPLLFVLVTLIYFNKEKLKVIGLLKQVILPILLYATMMLPQIILFRTFAGQARINSLSLSKDLPVNRKIINYLSSYSAYFSPRNLFFDPDPNLQRSLPELSFFYSWMIIPFLVGIFYWVKEEKKLGEKIVVLFLLTSPIPASLAGDPFSSFRAYPIVFPLILIIAKGIESLLSKYKMKKMKHFVMTGIVSLSLLSLWRSNFFLLPKERFSSWSYGYSQLVEEIKKFGNKKIIIDDPIGTGYIETLFFQKYSPEKYQAESKIDLRNYYQIKTWENKISWANIEVKTIFWKTDVYTDQLIVAGPLAISPEQAKEHFFTKAFAIIGPDSKEIFNGYLTHPNLKLKDDKKKARLIL